MSRSGGGRVTGIALTLGVASALVMGAAAPAIAAQSSPPTAAEYVVVLHDGSNAPAAAERTREADGATVTAVYSAALDGFAAILPAGDVAALRADPQVASVTPARTFRIPTSAATTPPLSCAVPATCQTLTQGIRRVGADLSSTRSGDGTGQVNANVAVIDTGIDATHPDLNVVGGINCLPDGVAVGVDSNGHGTFVAGEIGARDDAAFVVGVAPGVRLWSVRVLDATGAGSDASVVCGIDWVTATRLDGDPANNIDVVNMSLGGPGADDQNCGRTNADPIHQAICTAVAAGVTFTVAAGNDGADLAGNVPAAYKDVLTATAITDGDGAPGGLTPDVCLGYADDSAAPFSNFASPADESHVVAAPGVCIVSDYPGGNLAVGSGTSFAAPLVTGTVALCIASGACAGLGPQEIGRRIVDDATKFNADNAAFGFLGDPQRATAGRDYGPLIDASIY